MDVDDNVLNSESSRALEILNKTCRYVNGVWEVGLLWKEDNMIFPNGRFNALKRLHLIER